LHPVLGRAMFCYGMDGLKPSEVEELVPVVGHGAEAVMAGIGEASQCVIHRERLGTAHAVLEAESIHSDRQGTTMVVCRDTPLITSETFAQLFEYHESVQSKATILTTKVADPTGYGRVLRSDDEDVTRIVEHKDATAEEKLVNEIN